MTALNLFPYRQQAQQHKVNRLLSLLGASVAVSLLTALLLGVLMEPSPSITQAQKAQARGDALQIHDAQDNPFLNTADHTSMRGADMDRMHQERSKRLKWLAFLHLMANTQIDGVTVAQLAWRHDSAHIHMWAASPLQLEPWVQALEGLVSPAVMHSPPEPLHDVADSFFNTLGYEAYRFDVNLENLSAHSR